MNHRFERLAALVCVAAFLASAATIAGCAQQSPNATGAGSKVPTQSVVATSGASGVPTRWLTPGTVVETLAPVPERLADKVAQYDKSYVRVTDMSSVRKTYGIDASFPEQAAGGKLAGMWMQVPDVDGGFAWALYDASLVEVGIWIAPSAGEAARTMRAAARTVGDAKKAARDAKRAVRRAARTARRPGDAPWGTPVPSRVATPTFADVNGSRAVVVPRIWKPGILGSLPGSPDHWRPARWSEASVTWALGQCVVTVKSAERDVADLLGVARAVKIAGTVRMPKPAKAKKK
jgi:hypothetical protein